MATTQYDSMFGGQYTAGTGKKRYYPYTGVMEGKASLAPEKAKYEGSLAIESEYQKELNNLERERINQIADQFNKEYALSKEASDISKEQAKTASMIQAGGIGMQGAIALANPETREAVKEMATKTWDFAKGVGGRKPAESFVEGGVTAEDMTSPETFRGLMEKEGVESALPAESTLAEGIPWAGLAAGGVSMGMRIASGQNVGKAAAHGLGTTAGAVAGQYLIPIPGVGAAIGAVAGDMLTEPVMDVVEDVGRGVGNVVEEGYEAVKSSCLLYSYLYGRYSHQVRYAQVYCARFMSREMLLGYYQTARWTLGVVDRFGLREWVRGPAERFSRYMKWRLGRGDATMVDRVVSRGLLRLFKFVHSHTRNQFVPLRNCLPFVGKEV